MSSMLRRWRSRSPTMASQSSGSTSAMDAQASREVGGRVRVTGLFSPNGRGPHQLPGPHRLGGSHQLGDPQPPPEIVVECEPPAGEVLRGEAFGALAKVGPDLEERGAQVARTWCQEG